MAPNYLQAHQSPAENWWQRVPEPQRDWWMRRLNAMPHADGRFGDDIFRAPVAPGTETLDFDRLDINPDNKGVNYLAPWMPR